MHTENHPQDPPVNPPRGKRSLPQGVTCERLSVSLDKARIDKFKAMAADLPGGCSELLRRWIDERDREDRLTRNVTAGPETFRGAAPPAPYPPHNP